MGSDHSEQIKSLPHESEPAKGHDEHISTSQFDKQDENKKKDTAGEEDSSSSDKPGLEVRIDQTEDTTKENQESIADEQIKENIQGNHESQEDGSKDLPSTTEDSGVSLGQGMDDPLQLVSLVCHVLKAMVECLNVSPDQQFIVIHRFWLHSENSYAQTA